MDLCILGIESGSPALQADSSLSEPPGMLPTSLKQNIENCGSALDKKWNKISPGQVDRLMWLLRALFSLNIDLTFLQGFGVGTHPQHSMETVCSDK